jgi:ribonuclease HI
MAYFKILKAFNVSIHHPNAPSIKEVVWLSPIVSWVKSNTDGTAAGNPGQAASGGVFRDHNAIFLDGFSVNLGFASTFHAELLGVINAIENAFVKKKIAIEIAYDKGWWNLWLETDSMMVTLAHKSPP